MLNHLEKAFWTIGDMVLTKNHSEFHSQLNREPGTVTSELVISHTAKSNEIYSESETSLSALTKSEICELAAERFGIELSMRDDKKTLIDMFLFEQEQS
jgi:hypothetical protein